MKSRCRMFESKLLAFAAILLTLLLLAIASPAQAASFTPGNLVVYRVGSGTGSLVNTGNPVYLDEYTPSGVLIQSIALPTTANGLQKQLIASGIADFEGFLTLSSDRQYLLLTGYGTTIPYSLSLSSSTAISVPRVIGRVDANGNIDTSTGLTDFSSATSPRSAVSSDGTTVWVASSLGIRVTTLGAVTSTLVSSVNSRQVNIFSGQLYLSTGTGTNTYKGVNTVGTGLPTSSGQTVSRLPGLTDTTNPSAYGFFLADLDGNVAGFDTLYVADDDVAALQKFSLVSDTWSANGIIGTTTDDYRGLTGAVSGTTVTLYATRKGGSGSTGGGELVTLTDASGYNGVFTGTPTLLATASISTAFRGVAFVPVPIATATPTATNTSVPSATPTTTSTSTSTPTHTPVNTSTNTPIPSNTPTASETATNTTVPTATATTTPTHTPTTASVPSATPTTTDTTVPTVTLTATPTITNTTNPTNTPNSTLTVTSTPAPSATVTPTIMPTAAETAAPTTTAFVTATPTGAVAPTITATHTPVATNTVVATATNTGTPVPTTTDAATATSIAQATVTAAASDTPMSTVTPTVSATSTPSPTGTNLPTATATQIATMSATPTASNTPTAIGTTTATATATLTPQATVVVSTDQPATLTYTDTEGAVIAVQLPPGAVSETITLAYTDLGTLPSDPPSGFQFGNQIFDLDAFHNNTLIENFTFQKPVTITLNYSAADVVDLDEATLTVRYFDPKTQQWQTDGITIVERDLNHRRITFTVTHLTVFGMFGSSGTSFRGYLPLVVR